MKSHVLGFLFNNEGSQVVLIRKNRPDWQSGLLNGIGGKIEQPETARMAMAREFKEESGVESNPEAWRYFAKLHGPGWEVFCYETRSFQMLASAKTMTDEEVVIESVDFLCQAICVPDLKCLIYLALSKNGNRMTTDIHYRA